MKLNDLPVGTRIYYNGDMANQSSLGVITKHRSDKWGQFVDTKLDDGRKQKSLPICIFSPVYLGHGGTRFVTEKAYDEYRANQIKVYTDRMAKFVQSSQLNP